MKFASKLAQNHCPKGDAGFFAAGLGLIRTVAVLVVLTGAMAD